ncbi:MAG TPA: deoxyribose-phosphate aldolase [Atribacteraceae bacterium]|nr:deoxyribose-phosphate aldolase [Atribacteraceae bacterium]
MPIEKGIIMPSLTTDSLRNMLEHSLLYPGATDREIDTFCMIVKKYRFATAYVLPVHLERVVPELSVGMTKIGTGIGFPFGTSTTKMKLLETEEAMNLGAEEIDVVIHIGALRSGRYQAIAGELERLRGLVENRPLKIILEVSYLQPAEIITGSQLCVDAGVDYVKTASGFGIRDSTIDDVQLIAGAVSGKTKVKVAGGIRDTATLIEMYKAGAVRFGVSRGNQIIDEFVKRYGGEIVL